jgi:Fic family protein
MNGQIKELEPGDVYRIEPLTVDQPSRSLEEKSQNLIIKSSSLSGYFVPEVQTEVRGLVKSMNGYYSNLIEGHQTRPEDIERALAHDFSTQPRQKDLQVLHLAHLKTQTAIEDRLAKDPTTPICQPDFLKWIHRVLYEDLPDSLRIQVGLQGKEYIVVPGEFRDHEVVVGNHRAPPWESLEAFFKRFAAYEDFISCTPTGVINGMAAHHRLAWLHPFPDGNGRVARLFTHAWLLKAGIQGLKMWTLSRGLARSRDQYYSRLVAADSARSGDFDGRGARSRKGLIEFCEFMIETAIDQVEFMKGLLAPATFIERAYGYCRVQEELRKLPTGSAVVYRDALYKGRLTRGEVGTLSERSRRSAQLITKAFLDQGYCVSPSPKGDLTPAFPPSACSSLFPELYPAGGPPTVTGAASPAHGQP